VNWILELEIFLEFGASRADKAAGSRREALAGQPAAKKPDRLGASVPGVVALCAFRQKTFTSSLAASGESGAAAFGTHTGAESVLAFARPFRGLIGAFHYWAVTVWEGEGLR